MSPFRLSKTVGDNSVVTFNFSTPVDGWWKEFQKNHAYPLYGIILASSSDVEVASFVQSAYTELDKIAGEECCLIFFRERAFPNS